MKNLISIITYIMFAAGIGQRTYEIEIVIIGTKYPKEIAFFPKINGRYELLGESVLKPNVIR